MFLSGEVITSVVEVMKLSLGLSSRRIGCWQVLVEDELSAFRVAGFGEGDSFLGVVAVTAVVALGAPALACVCFLVELALEGVPVAILRGFGLTAGLPSFFADVAAFGAVTFEEGALEFTVGLGSAFF